MSNFFQLVFNKNPHIKKHFDKIKSLPINHNFSEEMIFDIFSKYKKFQQLFKNNQFNIIQIDSFESMEDTMHEIIQKHEVMLLCKSMLSSKYMNLVSETSLNILRSLIDSGLQRSDINPYLSKIKAFNQQEQLSEVLQKCYEDHISFDINSILSKIKKQKLNAEVAYVNHKTKILVLKINDYLASNQLGSSSWCISYSKNFFERYTKMKHPKNKIFAIQYFYYDFKLPKTHRLSMVGATLSFDHYIFAADRFDSQLTPQYNIIKNNEIVNFIYTIHTEKYHNQSFLLKRFLYTLKGDSLESFLFIKEKINSLKIKKLTDQEIISILVCFERFKASVKRAADNFLTSIIIQKYKDDKHIPESLIEYFEKDKPNFLIKLHYSGFHINSKALQYIKKT